jgi:hypothetical protein
MGGYQPPSGEVAMADTTTFLQQLQTDGLCEDWLPWSQDIKDVLHGGITAFKSDDAAGLCNVISAYVLVCWRKNQKFDTAPLLELENDSVGQLIDSQAREPDASKKKFFIEYLLKSGFPKGNEITIKKGTIPVRPFPC